MRLRSLLFVPGDRPDRMDKALTSGADALILDLEDAVATDAKNAARTAVIEFLANKRDIPIFVRLNPLDGEAIEADIAMLARATPDGVVLPKAEGAASVRALIDLLPRGLPILPIATETPVAIFQLGTYGEVAARLAGLTWGAEDLPAAIGAATSREADGRYTAPYEIARSLTLFAAHAASVPAIETVYPAFRDSEGLAAYAARGARDGFTGMLAIHPAQVPTINAAFTPSPEAVARAREIVALFAANPGAGAIGFEGHMLDAPHLKQAQALLASAAGGALDIAAGRS